MNTPLTPKIERLIQERLQRGRYHSAAEVVEDAFEALVERENLQAIRAELDHADDQLVRGEYLEYDESNLRDLAERVKARGQERLAERPKSPGS